ncbi:MAG: DinB family protein [Candidatus Zixiibacteriota bacterium]
MKSVIWFDRAFTFDMPNEMFPMVVERLRGMPARIEERTASLDREILIRHIDDCWSIQENVGHLWDLEPLWFGRIEDFRAGRERLRPAELTNKKTHEAHHNDTTIEYLLKGFRTSRKKLISALDNMDDKLLTITARHPRLDQPMRVIDCAFFIAEHDDHHLAEITRLLKSM